METSVNVPICISTYAPDSDFYNIEDHCTFQQTEEKWGELEQFWGEQKQRLLDYDSQAQQLCSSLERSLLFDECLQEPKEDEKEYKDESSYGDSSCVVRGEDIIDVPTQYVTNGFKPNELIIIGTYIDKSVIPGFKYKVRKNLTEKYFFNGKALRLEQIGLGYGKRLTFESPSLNKNTNYFWSDSCAAGFGFTLQALSPSDKFTIHEPLRGEHIGRAVITDIESQVVKSTLFGNSGRVEKLVEVSFRCQVVVNDRSNHQTLALDNVFASGVVFLVKKNSTAKAEVESIILQDFLVKDCKLKPDN